MVRDGLASYILQRESFDCGPSGSHLLFCFGGVVSSIRREAQKAPSTGSSDFAKRLIFFRNGGVFVVIVIEAVELFEKAITS